MRTTILFLALFLFSSFLFAQKILAELEFRAENIKEVNIDGSFCDVVVKKGDEVYFKGIIEGAGDEGDYEIISDINGSQLDIEVDRKGSGWSGWNKMSKALLELTVPDNVDVMIDNSSGDVTISGIKTSRIRVETSSGDIDIKNLTSKLYVSSSSGDIRIEKLKGDVNAESTSGDQELYFVEGNVIFDATSGDVELKSIVGDISGETTSGNIEVYRSEGSLDLRCTSGDIEGDEVIFTSDSRFRTSSGDVDISLNNEMKDLSFDLEASSGDLSVNGRRAEKSLYIKEGDIWINGVSSSGNQRYSN